MKRFFAIVLAGLMLLSLAACGAKDENVIKIGVLEGPGYNTNISQAHEAHRQLSGRAEKISYNNLSSALLDLESGKIAYVLVEECVAEYVIARNENVAIGVKDGVTNYSMMTSDSNKEVYDILNNAIKAMKEDGTLDSLIENELKAYINSDPVAKDLPHFEGAKTIKVGVTGDVPPMDFVAANGQAAGFNIALLAEIANRAQVNIELVQIDTGSRPMALSSGKVDAIFWTKNRICGVCGEERAEKIDGTLVTESYFADYAASLVLKSDK